ncbi:MAG: glycosyltransferase family 39 protein, partial [Acidobacteriota bacterium]
MPRTKLTIAILCALTCVLWIIRLAAPDDLLDRDQERPASYLLDIVENGQWIVQTDAYGHVASKPPASLWVAAPAALLVDGAPRWVRTLPSFLGVLGTALLVWWIGRRGMGDWPGILAALLFLATPMAAKAVALVRTDAFFTFAVTLTACLAYRAWQDGKGWTGIWLAGTLATLTKGPQGLVFALGGLLAVRGSQTAPPRWRAWLPGVVLWILIAGGWLLAATFVLGDAVTDKMLGDELVGHVVEGDGGEIPGTRFWVPLLSILIHAAPWSLVLPVAAVWVWRRRHLDSNAVEHPAEYGDLLRFALFWLLVGLAVLALAGHQRRDLVMPMVPAA